MLDGSAEQQAGRTWQHRKADGTLIDVAIFSRLLTYENRSARLIAAIDITERKRAEARVVFMAHHDALTTLPNRVLLRLRMEEMLGRLRRNGESLAALCIDLDNFKTVNDTLGHPFGDLLLQAVADRLRAVVREQDTVARLGGDEFAILQTGVTGADDIGAFAQRVLTAISEPYDLEGHHVCIGASIGIAVAPGEAADANRAVEEFRYGALPRQERRPEHLPLLRSRDGRTRAGAPHARGRAAQGAGGQRIRAALSAAGRSRERRHHRLRGAAALAASGCAA